MKPIIKTLALCALLGTAATAYADVTVTVKTSLPWLGFMNISYLPADGGGTAFTSAWGTADLRAVFSSSELTLSPNTVNPPNGLADAFWFKPDGSGNKIMDASLYVEVGGGATTVGALSGQNVTFTGTVNATTLTSAHTSVAFIKDFAPDYSSSNTITAPLVNGAFSITLATDPGVGRHVQYGFETIGANVWAANVGPFGSVKIAALGTIPGNPNVKVDPALPWQGYINVFNLPVPDGDGAYLTGYAQPVTTELRAAFTPGGLVLSPFTIDPLPDGINDSYWYQSNGNGNKSIDANLYVQPQDGSLSGQTVNFSGTVLANSLTGSHTIIAFIKEYVANYSSSTVNSAVLTPGPFSVSLAISSDPSRHVQYGFQTVGSNVWPANAGPFGSVKVASDITNSYATWLARYDFSTFTNPDLTATGDPDRDGSNNFTEFALDGNPTTGIASGKLASSIVAVSSENAMLLTLPVFNGAIFSGSPSPTASVGQWGYTIQGSNGLIAFDQAVTEISPARTADLPVISSGWTYRSFRLNGAVGGATPRGPTGFLRARISTTP